MRPTQPETSATLGRETSPRSELRHCPGKNLMLDIGIDATRVKFLESEFYSSPLFLPAEGRPLITSRERRGSVSLSGGPADCLGAFLQSAKAELPLRSSTVVVGNLEDPLLPFREKFESTMRFFDRLLRSEIGHLTVATRSPLIVTAAPIFRRDTLRTALVIAVESDRDQTVRRLTPELPRASERLRAAKALKALGLDVSLQVSPFLPKQNTRHRAAEFASALVDTGCPILVTSVAQIAAPCEYPQLEECSEFGHLILCEELNRRGSRGHRLDPQAGEDRAA